MKIKITFTTVLLLCFALSMACNVNLGSDEVAASSKKETKKSGFTKAKSEKSEKSEKRVEKKSLLQDGDDEYPIGSTKADEYYTDTYLDQNGGRIRFGRGESSAVVNGKIKNHNDNTYIVGAKAGQTLYVNITAQSENNDVVFQLIAPNGDVAGEEGDTLQTFWQGELPQSGDYKIVFGTFETTNTDFTFFISID